MFNGSSSLCLLVRDSYLHIQFAYFVPFSVEVDIRNSRFLIFWPFIFIYNCFLSLVLLVFFDFYSFLISSLARKFSMQRRENLEVIQENQEIERTLSSNSMQRKRETTTYRMRIFGIRFNGYGGKSKIKA